jgi:hypothetical protein
MQVFQQIFVQRIVETGKFFCPKCAVYADHQRVEYRKWQAVGGFKVYPVTKPWQLVKCAACYSEGKPHIPLDPLYWDAQKRQQFTKYVLQDLVGVAREGGRVIHPAAWSYIREAYVHACGELPNEIDLGNLIRYQGYPRSIDDLNLDRKALRRVDEAKEILRREFKTKRKLSEAELVTHQAVVAQENRAYQTYLSLRGAAVFDDLPAIEQEKIQASLQELGARLRATASTEMSRKAGLLRRNYPRKFLTREQWKRAGKPKQ